MYLITDGECFLNSSQMLVTKDKNIIVFNSKIIAQQSIKKRFQDKGLFVINQEGTNITDITCRYI